MTESGDRLARVSYLPGAGRPPEQEPARTPAPESRDDDGWYVEPSAKTPRRGPVFLPTPEAESLANHREARPAESGHAADTVAADAAPAEAVPVSPRESPAMKKMRALVEAAAGATEDSLAGHARRPYGQKSYAEDPIDADDAPPSAAEMAARAERVSMSALTRKGMSSWEMSERLKSQDLDDETIANEVARLEGVGLLNDFGLAETLVRTLQDRKGLGRSGITAELRRRHVDQSAIDEALEALDSDDEAARALEIALKRAPQLRSLDSATAHRRLSAFLMRKGYSGSVISAAVAGALEPGRGPRFR
jgi:regulatory protein